MIILLLILVLVASVVQFILVMEGLNNLKTAVDELTTRIDAVLPRITGSVADSDVQAQADRVAAQNQRIADALNPPPAP